MSIQESRKYEKEESLHEKPSILDNVGDGDMELKFLYVRPDA